MKRLLPLLLAACGASSSPRPDAGPPDAASPDAGVPPDAGCDCDDDGIACTREVCDDGGACAHVSDDSLCAPQPCQVARCDPGARGCISEPVEDGTACGEGAFGGPPPRCYSGACVPGRVVDMQMMDLSIRSPVPAGYMNIFDCLLRLSDVDGDGLDDIAACERATSAEDPHTYRGALQAYSTATGELLWSKTGSNEDAWFAMAIVSRPKVVGDLDGDARVDVVAAEWEEPGVASLTAIDGSDGSELWRFSQPTTQLIAAESAGDRDGDGVADVLAWYYLQSAGSAEKLLEIRSGADGSVIQSRSLPSELHGWLQVIDDLDGDGADDLLITRQAGEERIYSLVSSASLDVIGTVEPPGVGGFCWRVGDLNGDGTDENTFEEYQPDWENPVPTSLWAFDLTTGETLWSRAEKYQSCPTATYDLDGDGARDLIYRSRQLGALSGSDGTALLEELFPADWRVWPRAMLQVGDLNGDGAEDWACGGGAAWMDGEWETSALGVWFFASVVEY